MRLLFLLATFLVCGILASFEAQADFYLHPWENEFELSKTLRLNPEFTYYTSKSNSNGAGTNVGVAGLTSYTRMGMDLNTVYGLNRSISLYGRLNWIRNEISHTTLSGSVYGFGDQTMGLTYRVLQPGPSPQTKRFTLDFQFQANVPFYSNPASLANNTPFLGDGSKDLTVGAFLTLPLSQGPGPRWLLSGGGGSTWRSSDFSAALPWSVTLHYWLPEGEGLFFNIAISGIQSLKTDPKGTTGDISSAGLGAGGSFAINGINPSLVTAQGLVGYQLHSDLAVTASLSQTVWGQATPVGFAFQFGLQARFEPQGGGLEPEKNLSKLNSAEYGKANQGFINYTSESKVIRVHDRLNLIKIDKGKKDGVEVGQIFDIFSIRKDGSVSEAVARAQCLSVDVSESSLKVTEYYREVWIEEGFIAKRPLP